MSSFISLSDYLSNPCGTLSIPYWKAKNTPIPDSIVVLHQNDFCKQYKEYQRYFRLLHTLDNIKPLTIVLETMDVSENLKDTLNQCFQKERIVVSLDELYHFKNHLTYHKDLWLGIKEQDKWIACGIAEYDKEVKEGSIEWLCVLPNYQRKGLGTQILNGLLYNLKELGAQFATVSGRMENASNPEKFYRSCGFTGTDIWYIYKRQGE